MTAGNGAIIETVPGTLVAISKISRYRSDIAIEPIKSTDVDQDPWEGVEERMMPGPWYDNVGPVPSSRQARGSKNII